MMSGYEIFENVVEIHQEDDQTESTTKEQKMAEYVRSLATLEDAMEPYKEQKRELKKEFKEEGWLTGDEISMTVKAYRMMKNEDFDFDEFTKIYESLAKVAGRV
jgi:predicted RNase H-like nuclease (RuvC/YqgF family)